MSIPSSAITEQAVSFIENLRFDDLPTEALRIGRRCMVDTFGVMLAGTSEHAVHILMDDAAEQGGRPDAFLLAAGWQRVPAAIAARVLATAGHAHDWDDTQVSHDPAHVYGLLTHPSVPPLTAALVMAQRLGGVDGRRFMLAFQTGFEVECKISEWMLPRHYRRGHHSSGTVGTFGAAAATAKLLGLKGEQLAHALGIAASFAAGIRASFGTMTKPLHVGRAAENGVTAALLAARGFTADPAVLDGPWGFFSVMGEGFDPTKIAQGFGRQLTITDPGVSIKPYPSGILTHQSMDAMLKLVLDHDLKADEVERIRFYAGKNILEPIRYPVAANHLQAKFSMPALLCMILLKRRASHHEFMDSFVASPAMQDLQKRTQVLGDPQIDALGYDLIRSRIEVDTRDGRTLVQWADERYRGGPLNPLSDADLEGKFRMCAEGALDAGAQAKLLEAVHGVENLTSAARLAELMVFDGRQPH
ncbi:MULTISPECIES: MmgE/PrpD family protein [unclassified Beijerinckia]|uniref:MmgE/PrpD family protein n=1 Tax=unclassified Beijerinckia TaxID=2638183 RepID=UPI00089894D0|nr:MULTISPECIES: MmgE/PrpD family protein [unclassified Beijerinckia]MDH7795566.1 2-methylcitrate dehydratase PrpD [Beijerinckia sp. GAS462]SEC06913.1 2-methylcitrate dehydratase PrpD [Beijerinckia sp. 28-YEA-48]